MNQCNPDAQAREVPHGAPVADAASGDPGAVADEDMVSGVRQRLRAVAAQAGAPPDTASVEKRLGQLELRMRWMKLTVLALVILVGFMAVTAYFPASVIVRQTLLESKELKLLDSEGNPRLFLRMFSRVPVLQLLDAKGKPRMSLGLRFDNTPFLDLSDKTGRTRITLEMNADDEPTLALFDDKGETTFKIK